MAGRFGPLAQLVEQGTLNPKVAGSIPARPIAPLSGPRAEPGWPFRRCSCKLRRAKRGLGGRATSSGTEPLATTAESVDDAVRRLVVERSHDLVTLCDLNGAIVYASPSWAHIGWEPAELTGVQIGELLHPDDAGLANEAWNEVAAGTDVDAVTIRLRRAGGSFAWFEVNGSAVRDEAGELRFMLGTARDVSEREELRSRLRDLDAVYRFADAVSGAQALDEVLEAALDTLLEATGADRASVLLADDAGVLRFRAWRGLSDRYRASTEGRSPWPSDAEDPQPVLVEDIAAAGYEPALERVMRKEGIGALAFLPLVRGGRLFGRFALYRDTPHRWSDRDVLLARTIANHLASVIERADAQQALHASSERLALLLEATEQLTQTLDYEELLRRVPQLVVPRIADGCHVYIARNETELVRVAHAHVEPRIAALLDKIDAVYDVSSHKRIPVVQVFRTGKPIHRPALTRPLKKVARPGEEELVRMEARSLVVVPLETGGRRLGVLAVTSAEPGRHGDEDFELVSELARRVSLALDLVGLHRQAQDSLAQLHAVIAQLPLGVAITDADHRIILRNDELERVWGAPIAIGYDHRASDVDTSGWPLERAIETGEVTSASATTIERDADDAHVGDQRRAGARRRRGDRLRGGDPRRRHAPQPRGGEPPLPLAGERAARREPRLGAHAGRDRRARGARARRATS